MEALNTPGKRRRSSRSNKTNKTAKKKKGDLVNILESKLSNPDSNDPRRTNSKVPLKERFSCANKSNQMIIITIITNIIKATFFFLQ